MNTNSTLFILLCAFLPFSCQISGTEECPDVVGIPLNPETIENYYTYNQDTMVFKTDTLIDTLSLVQAYSSGTRAQETNQCVSQGQRVILYVSNSFLISSHPRFVLQAQTDGKNNIVFFPCSSFNCDEHLLNDGIYDMPRSAEVKIEKLDLADTTYQNVNKVSYVLDEADYQLFFSEQGHLIRIVEPNHTWDLVERL